MQDSKSLLDLDFSSDFVKKFPGDPEPANFTRQVPNALYSKALPARVADPKLIAWSDDLASELRILKPEPESSELKFLSGNLTPSGHSPYAARYGGHQFGNWAGQLGDGRAITLGEAQTAAGKMEFQLKGAGPTPYSRRGDGRAVLRSSIREFLCSEAMHFLGVPTTRALSLVLTGDAVVRDQFYDGNPLPEPGAIVCRVSPSFLRFGNFEILARSSEFNLLKDLADHTLTEFFKDAVASDDPDRYGKLLDEVCKRTALMIAHWMRVGFVHGVMNTDNMSVLGLTIDYGPYGWLEPFDPGWTPNTTDEREHRYRYGNQPSIALWNLTRFAEALMPLLKDEKRAHLSLDLYRSHFSDHYSRMLASKLGLPDLSSLQDSSLCEELFALLARVETDMTVFFRNLSQFREDSHPTEFLDSLRPSLYQDLSRDHELAWLQWAKRYQAELIKTGWEAAHRKKIMDQANPKYVLRNYLAQQAIDAAEKGDYCEIENLMTVLKSPYLEQKDSERFAQIRPEWARSKPGCSSLSCSS